MTKLHKGVAPKDLRFVFENVKLALHKICYVATTVYFSNNTTVYIKPDY